MRAVLVRSLLVIGAGAVVLAGVLYVASTVDTRPPTVLDIGLTQPLDDPERALITTSIEVGFSEPVDPDSAVGAVALAPAVDGTVSWSGSTLIFTPSEPLDLATEYTVTVAAGIRDLAGNEMTELPDPFLFATTGRPSLAATDPADGATDVPVDAVIGLVFSRLMDTASVESTLEIAPAIDHELRWSGERLEIVPEGPLEPGTDYVIRVGPTATDVAGVAIDEEVTVGFRTVAAGLRAERLIPADGADGISPRTPIAIVLDRAIEPESVGTGLLSFEPELAGTTELVAAADDSGQPRVLRFTPSSPLPPNTTIAVTLDAELRAADGGRIAEPVSWTFTTGAPQATLSNQVLFLSDRSGVTNVWAMNPDGTGQHQVSAELEPVLDYAAAPTGSSLVVADGRRLVFVRADGSDRRVLTDAAHLEFDPAYAPDGSELAFARADVETGMPLGLWRWEIGAGSASELELPAPGPVGFSPSPAPTGEGGPAAVRAPRYSPDGTALTFVDLRGAVGILELPGQRLTLVSAAVASAPTWNAGSDAILVRLDDGPPGSTDLVAPVVPLDPAGATDAGVVRRSGTAMTDAGLEASVQALVTAPDGRIGWIDDEGTVWISSELFDPGDVPEALEGLQATELVFGPAEGVVLVVTERGDVVRVDLDGGQRTRLTSDGRRVRWLP